MKTYGYSLDAPTDLDGEVRGRVIGTRALLDLCRDLNALRRLLRENGYQDLLPLLVRARVFEA
ncbi:hypothetical protein IMZ48_12050 [Candidatus Bathyarchaeota archaeon]|nr:hypothetical protein [Candidatus Bathyarchaeota archaeon]